VLYAPHKTPEVKIKQVRMNKGGESTVLIENYKPSEYILEARNPSAVPA